MDGCVVLDDNLAEIQSYDANCADIQAYHYKPLKNRNIRLLRFGHQSSEFSICEVLHVSLNTCPKFHAVSYCWGTDTETCGLAIADGTYITISKTVLHMLQVLLGQQDEMTLWIDAVCINQADLTEKGKQVSLMGEVYSLATDVLVWLGDCTRKNEETVQNWMSEKYVQPPDRYGALLSEQLECYRDPRNQFRDRTADEEAVHILLNVPWFTRTWVVQEACLARSLRFRYGRLVFSWSFLYGILYSIMTNPSMHPMRASRVRGSDRECAAVNFGIAIETLRTRLAHGEPIDLVWLVKSHQTFEATNPRDKIYGSLGLERGPGKTAIVPNYRASVSTVFQEATEAMMEQMLFILQNAGLCYQEAAKNVPSCPPLLPSWVPDYSNSDSIMPCIGLWWKLPNLTHFGPEEVFWQRLPRPYEIALPDRTSPAPDVWLDKVLSFHGWHVQTITKLGPACFEFTQHDRLKVAAFIDDGLQLIQEHCRRFSRTEDPQKICTDIIYTNMPCREDVSTGFFTLHFLSRLPQHTLPEHVLLPLWHGFREFFQQCVVRKIPSKRTFCCLDDGHLGLCPYNAEVGDLVVVLGRMEYPVLLRRSPEVIHTRDKTTKNLYRLVGDIYVEGFLTQRVSSILRDDRKMQSFALW